MLLLAWTLAACTPFSATHPEGNINETVAPAGASSVDESATPPRSLLGLRESDIVGMLGEAAFSWTEGDARMWRYDGASCQLLVFLYPDGVRHIEALGGTPQFCLCEIRGGCT